MEEFIQALFEDLFVATVGGGAMMLYSKLITRFNQIKLEKKYPISGEYLSIFEDIVNGNVVNIKAPVLLNQKGRKIEGYTKLDSRKWILEGKISDAGYIYGLYYAESIHDKGVGNFFLEFTNNGNLEGIWSGYDSINKKIVSGKYIFKKKPIIVIKKVESNNLSAILHIADKQLGKDFINTEDFIQDNFLKFQAEINNKIVGFITSKELTIDEIYARIPQLKEKKFKQFNVIDKVSFIGSVATDPEYEGLGVASVLFEHILNELERKKNIIFMIGWKSIKGINIEGIAKRNGFDAIMEIEEFWKEDSIKNQYDCPICKNPCVCSAIIYVRHLNNY